MNIPEHGHCEICQTPVTVGERFCGSAACEEKHEQNIKDKKKQVAILIFLVAAVMVYATFFGR